MLYQGRTQVYKRRGGGVVPPTGLPPLLCSPLGYKYIWEKKWIIFLKKSKHFLYQYKLYWDYKKLKVFKDYSLYPPPFLMRLHFIILWVTSLKTDLKNKLKVFLACASSIQKKGWMGTGQLNSSKTKLNLCDLE